jgi:hypothetical protein
MKFRESTTEEQEQMSDAIERLQLKNADLRAKLVALRDAASDANEWTWTCYSSVEDMCIKGDYKEEIFAHLSIVSDKLKTALDSVKDVKP